MAVMPIRATTTRIGGDAIVVSVSGELDLHTVPALEQELDAAHAAQVRRVILDLVGTTFLDSVSLGVITRAAKRLRTERGELVVVADDRRIIRVFEITGLDRVFRIERSLAEAVEQLVGRAA